MKLDIGKAAAKVKRIFKRLIDRCMQNAAAFLSHVRRLFSPPAVYSTTPASQQDVGGCCTTRAGSDSKLKPEEGSVVCCRIASDAAASIPATPACTACTACTTPVVRFGIAEDKGGRRQMQDVAVVVRELSELIRDKGTVLPKNSAYFAVFDGNNGDECAKYAKKSMLDFIVECNGFPNDLDQALPKAFLEFDKTFCRKVVAKEEEDSGTTALLGFCLGDEVVLSHLGDCRAVLSEGGRCRQLTEDHRPENPVEHDRIIAAGGTVTKDGVNNILGVARCLGNVVDFNKEAVYSRGVPSVLSSVPDIIRVPISPESEFLIVASDGLWDVMSSNRAVELARVHLLEHNDPDACARHLVNIALGQCGTTDNITVMLVMFQNQLRRREPVVRPKRAVSVQGLSKLKFALQQADGALASPKP